MNYLVISRFCNACLASFAKSTSLLLPVSLSPFCWLFMFHSYIAILALCSILILFSSLLGTFSHLLVSSSCPKMLLLHYLFVILLHLCTSHQLLLVFPGKGMYLFQSFLLTGCLTLVCLFFTILPLFLSCCRLALGLYYRSLFNNLSRRFCKLLSLSVTRTVSSIYFRLLILCFNSIHILKCLFTVQ